MRTRGARAKASNWDSKGRPRICCIAVAFLDENPQQPPREFTSTTWSWPLSASTSCATPSSGMSGKTRAARSASARMSALWQNSMLQPTWLATMLRPPLPKSAACRIGARERPPACEWRRAVCRTRSARAAQSASCPYGRTAARSSVARESPGAWKDRGSAPFRCARCARRRRTRRGPASSPRRDQSR